MKKILITLFAIVLLPTSAMALDAKREQAISMDAKTAWAKIGDFCGITNWHPAVVKCDLSEKKGALYRTLTLGGGATILERLEMLDRSGLTYTYSIIESPLPIKNYKSTFTIQPNGEKANVVWSSNFDSKGASDEEATKVVTGIYEAGLKKIAETN